MLVRTLYTSMKDSFQRGRLFFDKTRDVYLDLPNLDILPNACKAYEEAISHFEDRETFLSAYHEFLKDAILICYSYGRMDFVNRLFGRLHEIYPDERPRSLDEVLKEGSNRARDDLERHDLVAMIEGALLSELLFQRQGRNAEASQFAKNAAFLWKHYTDDRASDPMYLERTGLPPLDIFRESARSLFDFYKLGQP